MPTISMFYGIIIRMLFMDTQQPSLAPSSCGIPRPKGLYFNSGRESAGGRFPGQEIAYGAGVDSHPRRGIDGGLGAGGKWRTRVSD